MSSAVETFQMLDPRLAISDAVKFAVEVSGQSQNQQVFTSQTASTSQVTANCLIPSLQTVIDKRVQIRTRFQITVVGNSAGATQLVQYPQKCVFAAFPFSQMVQTLTAQVNNTSLNSNYEANLALMLRQMEPCELARYSDCAPTQLDYYQLAAQTGTLDSKNSVDLTPDYDVKSRGSFRIISIAGDTMNAGNNKTVVLTIETTEPLFISPFQFGDANEREAGLSGISSINFNFNLGASLVGRALTLVKAAPADAITSVTLTAIQSFQVLMTFLSPKPSQLIPLTNCQPYYEMPAYKTLSNIATVPAADFTMTSSIVSPNCIPDAVYLFIRDANVSAPDQLLLNEFYYPIKKVSITWNTQSGLLASAEQQILYQMSKKRGLKMDWNQFLGLAQGPGGAANTLTNIPTTGGIVCLGFNTDISIMEQYYSASSLGLWSFSAAVTATNNTAVNIANVELVVVFFQSGIFQSTSGSSSQYIGVLSKDEVLRVSQEPYLTHNEHHRYIGAGNSFLASLMKGSPARMKSLVKGGDSGGDSGGRRGGDSGGDSGGRRRVPRTY